MNPEHLVTSDILLATSRQLLRLEQQLEAYQLLHAEELTAIRRDIGDVKKELLRVLVEADLGTQGPACAGH